MKLAQPVSEHRIQRATRFAMLWLARVLGFLVAYENAIPDWVKRALRRPLYCVGRFVCMLITFRALRTLPAHRRRAARGRIIRRAGMRRAVCGQFLRKRLMRGDVMRRARALLHALFNLDALIATQARRLAHGVRRRGGFVREKRAAALAQTAFAALAIANTS